MSVKIITEAHLIKQRLNGVLFSVSFIFEVSEVSVVFLVLTGVGQGAHRIVPQLHAELHTLVKHLLRLVGRILIDKAQRLHKHLIVVDPSLNYTIANSLRHDLLRLLHGLETQLRLNVAQSNFRVRNVDLLQTELDHSVLESLDQGHVLVKSKYFGVLDQQGAELFHLALLDAVEHVEVWRQRLDEVTTAQDTLVRDFTHQQRDDNQEFGRGDTETKSADFWAFSKSLGQACLGSRVLKLHSLDPSNVVQVPGTLRIRHVLRKGRLLDKVAGLFVQVLLQVRPHNDVDHSGLALCVQVKAA